MSLETFRRQLFDLAAGWAASFAAGVLPILAQPLAAENLRCKHLTVEDGLAHTMVWKVHQDRLGFIWLATATELQRWDGHSFKSYKNDPDDPGSLSANSVLEIHEDPRGVLWLGTRGGGLNRYDRTQERFVQYRHDPDDPASLSADTIWGLTTDRAGSLWVGTTAGLDRLDAGGAFAHYRHDPTDPDSLSPGWVYAIAEDRQGDLWIATHGGLDRLTARRGEGAFIHYRHDPGDPESLGHDSVLAILEDRDGDLWVGTSAGLDRFDRSGRFERIVHRDAAPGSLSPETVTAIVEDPEGDLWIAHLGGGLSRLAADRAAGRQLVRYRHDPGDAHGLSSDQLYDLEVDGTGSLWIAGREGLDVFDRRRERFTVYRRGFAGMAGHQVWAIAEDRSGVLWIGTEDGGLAGFDRARQTAVETADLTGISAQAVLEDRHRELWVGTATRGLLRLDRDRRLVATYQPDPRDPGSLAGAYVRQLLEDRQGRLWVGGQKPLQRFSRGPGQERFVTPGSATDDRSGAGIYDLYEDRSGDLWIATTEGLERYDEAADAFVRYRHDPRDRNSLSSNVIHALLEDASGVFWIGTSAGLNRWHPERGEFRHFRERDGLPSDSVVGVQQDQAGRLWLATAAGISRFDPRSQSFRNYDAADGLHDTELFIGADHQNGRGELFFGGTRGLTSFFPDRIEDDSEPPAVVLTELRLAGEPARLRHLDPQSPLRRTITDTRELVLDHGQKAFSLEFAALHFANPRKNRYAYRLEGFDQGWSPTDARRPVARYTNLDAGRYLFRVKASNPDGVWNEDGATLRITVLPPPWRTWWAYTLYGLALATAVVAYVRSHRRELRRERQAAAHERAMSDRLREVDRLKDEFLANTSHELRTPLYGITGLAESLIDGAAGELPAAARTDLAMLVHSGRRLTALVDDILDFSKLKHQSLELDLRPVDLHALVDVVLTLSRPIAGSKPLRLVNAVAQDLPAALADENRLQQILHNLVGNAVKFTEAGEVEVSAAVRLAEGPAAGEPLEKMVVSVRDTGIGIPQAQQERIFQAFAQADASIEREFGGTGLGLAVTRQLIDLHGGHLCVESVLGEGSTFVFDLEIAGDSAEARQDARASIPRVARMAGTRMAAAGNAAAPSDEKSVVRELAPSVVPGDRASVMVVDDEPVIRQVVSHQLTAHGFRVIPAAGGPEALRLLGERSIDLVILDVMMPRMSGFEVCRKLREDHALEELPVIFLTARNRAEDLVVGLAAGANDYLPKPVSKSELLARVQTHVALLRVNRQLVGMVSERTSQLAERERLLGERELLIRELESRNAELARFNYTVAHDLKNPLITIRNFIGQLETHTEQGDRSLLRGDLRRIDAAASDLYQLVEQLFEFSRIDRVTLPCEEVPLGDLVEQALSELTPAIAERGIEIDVAVDLPVVCGDRVRLFEAVRHLLGNAVKYLADQPAPRIEVGVRAASTGEPPAVYVRDNGMGIEPRYRDRVFELFERLAPEASEGTGIGLALVKRIVEVHGGRIWIESEGAGKGSTFYFTLPVQRRGAVPASEASGKR